MHLLPSRHPYNWQEIRRHPETSWREKEAEKCLSMIRKSKEGEAAELGSLSAWVEHAHLAPGLSVCQVSGTAQRGSTHLQHWNLSGQGMIGLGHVPTTKTRLPCQVLPQQSGQRGLGGRPGSRGSSAWRHHWPHLNHFWQVLVHTALKTCNATASPGSFYPWLTSLKIRKHSLVAQLNLPCWVS